MSLRYHTTGLQTGRLVELYENVKESKYEVRHYINGKVNVYKSNTMRDAYCTYNHLAAI